MFFRKKRKTLEERLSELRIVEDKPVVGGYNQIRLTGVGTTREEAEERFLDYIKKSGAFYISDLIINRKGKWYFVKAFGYVKSQK
ncbi:MAG: hypothetical protein KatS3mg001_608 [Candidatus Pacearchaeota archaeon]|nr:MAG: hypothetical protein KatS3mg001_608 [Candidatus Pacearchaeota archaeon]